MLAASSRVVVIARVRLSSAVVIVKFSPSRRVGGVAPCRTLQLPICGLALCPSSEVPRVDVAKIAEDRIAGNNLFAADITEGGMGAKGAPVFLERESNFSASDSGGDAPCFVGQFSLQMRPKYRFPIISALFSLYSELPLPTFISRFKKGTNDKHFLRGR